MSTIKGNTVAAVRDGANAAFEQLSAELEAKREEIIRFAEALEAKTAEDEEHKAEINILKAENERFKEMVKVLEERVAAVASSAGARVETEKAEKEELVEVVAVPFSPSVKVPNIVYGGKTLRREKDADGFYHFFTEREHAESLLTSTAGLRFVLVGPMEKLTVKRLFGVRHKDVTVLRHVKTEYKTGGVRWVPIIEEESKDDVDA
jgi:hypothetical protein